MPGLGTTLGRGGATTSLQDLENADCILIQGSSMAEAHPVAFRWVMKARERGATIIHVDPRFSRTSAQADLWVPIRAGGDLAMLGGLIRIVLEEGSFFREYVSAFTNASALVSEDYLGPEDLDGMFSGWQGEVYDPSSWRLERDQNGLLVRDLSMEHERCVLQVLRRHFLRYTPETVHATSGIDPETLRKLADHLIGASGPERTTAICYAVGWTQHSKGVQIIRAAAILQLLLGNVGRPGGGLMALRGHASIQGSTDIPTLYDILPGYLKMPRAEESRDRGTTGAAETRRVDGTATSPQGDRSSGTGQETLDGWCEANVQPAGWWANARRYMVSLLKAYYGPRATPDNDFGFGWLPRVTRDHSHFSYWLDMADGRVEGLFLMGQNPSVGGQNARLERKALAQLKWLVVRDLVEIESATFWRDGPEIDRGELVTEDVETEVFLLPAAAHVEKAGSFTQTQRMLQWREKAVEPCGDQRSEAWFIHQLALRLTARAEREAGASSQHDVQGELGDEPRDAALLALDWWYPETAHGEPVPEAVLAEINGWHTLGTEGSPAGEFEEANGQVHFRDRLGRPHHGPQAEDFNALSDDGTTACGCWIYSGVYGPDGINRAASRQPHGRYGHGWGFAWPLDRRILYNRASARPDGEPWSERKALVWWDRKSERWSGHDVPDFPLSKPPSAKSVASSPDSGPSEALATHDGAAPFLMQRDGLAQLFVPEGLADGPLPVHYEPLESLIANPLYTQQSDPAARRFPRPDNQLADLGDQRFPIVLTTYRLTEHHTAGGMSRTLSRLSELQPELFVEMSTQLSSRLGIVNGDWVTVATLRGAVEARAMVTGRIRPLRMGAGADARIVDQVAMPFHWGWSGPNRGDVVNDLIPITAEPNVSIHESKALLCEVIPGRRANDRDFVAWLSKRYPETSFAGTEVSARARFSTRGQGELDGDESSRIRR